MGGYSWQSVFPVPVSLPHTPLFPRTMQRESLNSTFVCNIAYVCTKADDVFSFLLCTVYTPYDIYQKRSKPRTGQAKSCSELRYSRGRSSLLDVDVSSFLPLASDITVRFSIDFVCMNVVMLSKKVSTMVSEVDANRWQRPSNS